LDKGVDINRLIGPYKLTALVAAAWHGQSSTIDMLLKNGADPAVIVKGGNTALQLYVQLKAKQSAMYWENSEKGIKLSVNTQKPETKETLVNITKLLAVPEIINLHNFENEKTALIWAAEWSSLPIVETLIECGAEIDAVDKNGATALIWNAGNSNNDIAIQKTLLENGAEIDKANQSGLTALFVSYANDVQPYRTVTKFLLEQGADPNIYPANGGSMLCWAAVQNNEQDLEIVRILMEHGANPYLRSCSDCGNMDAFDYAKKYGNTKAIQIMESYKVD
jgi:ankyrin repeat protein